MKIRNGFVSNSSSSSFIIIGNKINIYNVTEDDLMSEDYSILIYTDMFFEDGFLMKVTDTDELDILRKHYGKFQTYKAYFYGEGDYEMKFDNSKIPNNCIIWTGNKSIHDVDNLEELNDLFEN